MTDLRTLKAELEDVLAAPAPTGREDRRNWREFIYRVADGLLMEYCRAGRQRDRTRELLIRAYLPLAENPQRIYPPALVINRDDRESEAKLALIHSLDRFDPARYDCFPPYGRACIKGHFQRYFRDNFLLLSRTRKYRDEALLISKAQDDLQQRAGSTRVTDEMLAQELGMSVDRINAARVAAYQTSACDSLDRVLGESNSLSLGDFLAEEDPGFELVDFRRDLVAAWRKLPPREQRILALRFFRDMTQAQIAAEVGISQMHVCRLINHALGILRDSILVGECAGTAA